MPRIAKQLFGLAAALGITLVVFGFFFWVVSLLPQPEPTVVTVGIHPSQPKP